MEKLTAVAAGPEMATQAIEWIRKMPDADQRRRETEAKPRAGTVRQMKAAVQMEEMPRKEQTAARTERTQAAGWKKVQKADRPETGMRMRRTMGQVRRRETKTLPTL